MRIISLMPSGTEILCSLGLASSIVGVSHACDWPEEIRRRPRLTRSRLPEGLASRAIHEWVHASAARCESLYEIDDERLAALDPELVIAQRQCSVCAVGEADAARAIRDVGNRARLLALAASGFGEWRQDVHRVAEATGTRRHALELIAQLEARLERIRTRTAGDLCPRVFCLSWFDPLMAAGHWMTDMVELAGGVDGLGARGATSNPLAAAAIEAYAPELILLMPCGFDRRRTIAEWEAARRDPFWSRLPAVKAGRVFVVDGSLFHRPGPRLVHGVEVLAALLHSGRCAELPASAQKVA